MRPLAADLWIDDAPLRFGGLQMGSRMTLIRLPDGRLLLHSPVTATPERLEAVRGRGPVAYLVAPNKLHHLSVADWQAAFPQAETYVAPGLETKRADLTVTGVLGDAPEPGWSDALDQVFVHGFPFANEVVFFHRFTRTLILTDLAFCIGPSSPWLTRVVFRLFGTFGRLSPTLVERLMVKDRARFRADLERILEWPFERVIVSHGDVVETGGREALERGYAWALKT